MSPLLISPGYAPQTTVKFLTNLSGHGRKMNSDYTKKSSAQIADMQSPDGDVPSLGWNNITGDEHKRRNYFKNKGGCISAPKHSLIATQSSRLHEHSSCKVFGMLQNKHWVSGSVSTFGCHSIHIHPPPPTPVVRRQSWNLSPHPATQITCHRRSCQRKSWLPLAQMTKRLDRKGCVNRSTSQVFFPKLCRHFVGSHSWDFQMCLPPRCGDYDGQHVRVYGNGAAPAEIRLHCPSSPGLHYAYWWFVSEST